LKSTSSIRSFIAILTELRRATLLSFNWSKLLFTHNKIIQLQYTHIRLGKTSTSSQRNFHCHLWNYLCQWLLLTLNASWIYDSRTCYFSDLQNTIPGRIAHKETCMSALKRHVIGTSHKIAYTVYNY
jgi:hypothetical protein